MRSGSVLLSALLLAGCLSGCDSGGRIYELSDDDEYVAIGDSYAAAPLTGPTDVKDGCLRSTTSYPYLVAKVTGADLTDVSCSSATTAALTSPFETIAEKQVAPQLDALSESTDLVTVGIGANDYNLFGVVFLTCVALDRNAPDDSSPCADADRARHGVIADHLAAMEKNVYARLEDVAERAPNARILVIGYPTIVPDGGTCDLLPLAAGDYPFARRVMDGINDAVETAADRADVEFIDVAQGTSGHDICSDDPWIAGARATHGRAAPWHPYRAEQDFIKDQILTELG